MPSDRPDETTPNSRAKPALRGRDELSEKLLRLLMWILGGLGALVLSVVIVGAVALAALGLRLRGGFRSPGGRATGRGRQAR